MRSIEDSTAWTRRGAVTAIAVGAARMVRAHARIRARARTRAAAIGLALGAFGLAGTPFGGGADTAAVTRLERAHAQTTAPSSERPFSLPFAVPPGPDTWLMGQPYGNTTGAYRQRTTTYGAGQGIHFGVDFSARCGMEVVAMADGVVFAADAMHFGAAPHNLMIDHPQLGYATFYGHLLDRPNLQSGQAVQRGQVVAHSGDPADTCNGRPHIHVEIRDLSHGRKYNPVLLVDADWDSLALVGPFGRGFQRDLDDPRKWQHLDDQPEIRVGGPLINNFARTWPPDSR